MWKPDIALKNSVLDYKELGVKSLNIENYFDGEIAWYPFQVNEVVFSFHQFFIVNVLEYDDTYNFHIQLRVMKGNASQTQVDVNQALCNLE